MERSRAKNERCRCRCVCCTCSDTQNRGWYPPFAFKLIVHVSQPDFSLPIVRYCGCRRDPTGFMAVTKPIVVGIAGGSGSGKT